MLAKTILLAFCATALSVTGAPVEGGGWIEDHPQFSQQQCAGGKIDGDTFSIPKNPNGDHSGSGCSNGHLRAERRYRNDYSSGIHQFGGEFKINSISGTRISVKQTFNGNDGPFFIMAVEKSGRLYSVEGGKTIAEDVAMVGSVVRINTVHDANKRRYSVYVNGKEAYRNDKAPGGSFYDKIGAYTTNSGAGGLSITWQNVQFWHK